MKNINDILNLLQSTAQDTNEKGSVFFIGIGGIGMSALARYFNSIGVSVSGYDKTETSLTKQLVSEGVNVHYDDDIDLLNKNAVLVVYTPAVPKDHKQYNWFLQNNYPVVKRSELLGAIVNTGFSICVAGTHGKTTTSSIVAHILKHTGYGCTAFLGGIASNYNSNFWSQEKNSDVTTKVFVAEADEYDRSFLKLNPDVAIITSMDADHLDIYGTAENVEQAFIDFSSKIKPTGCLIAKQGLKRYNDIKASTIFSYNAQNTTADIHVKNVKLQNGSYQFDVINTNWQLQNVVLNMGGMHNVENAIAAIGVAKYLKIEDEKIKAAVSSFKGVKRRFEYVIPPSLTNEEGIVFIDDYAHHPDELKALINGAKNLFPNKKCTIIFQPHLYSRTNDFADSFASVLDFADEVVLLPIYPARELPMPGVNSEMILNKMQLKNKTVKTKEELIQWVKQAEHQLLITAGAGDIDTLLATIKIELEK